MDKISIDRVSTLFPKLRDEMLSILKECDENNTPIRITQALRTSAYQADLFRKYVAGGPKAAPPGYSFHEYGMAVDICLLHKDGTVSFNLSEDSDRDNIKDFDEVAKVFEKYGWKWGKSFKDPDHFEKSFGYTVKQLINLKKDKDDYPILTNI